MGIAINGGILAWARQRSHLTVAELAVKMGNPPEIIESWEAGTDFPTYPQLEKLAYTVLKRPIAIFFLPEPPEEHIESSFRSLPESEFEKIPSSVERLIRRNQVLQLNLYELLEGRNPDESKLRQLLAGGKSFDTTKLATHVRSILGVSVQEQVGWRSPDEALKNWRDKVESAGLFVFKAPFHNNDFSGFCLYDEIYPIIVINNTMARSRQIFTLFHEIGHLLFRTSGIDKIRLDYIDRLPPEASRIEIAANAFAGELLVPAVAFADAWRQQGKGKIDELKIAAMADHFKVSRQVILRRLRSDGTIGRDIFEKFSRKWEQEHQQLRDPDRSGGDFYANQAVYLGRKYIDTVLKNMYRHAITQEQAAEYLNLKINQIGPLEAAAFK